ncbi:MAG: paraslipin [Desulfovibrionaceae bacterium]|nr:paraslipin [Desulfovibrionaceae bacterium]
MYESGFFLLVALAVIVVAILAKGIYIVPQQHAYVVERLGKFNAVLQPGLSFIIPFIDRVCYRHMLKEVPLDIPSQICITKDNTQLQVDGILYFQVTDPRLASYGSSDYVLAISQLAQTTLRSVIGRMELDKTFEERNAINSAVVAALDEAAVNWGVKVLRYEIKDLAPPREIIQAMQRQITAEREKRAVIAESEGRMQEQINLAYGDRQAAINQSEGERQAAINQSEGERQAAINRAQGEAEAILLVANATAQAITAVAEAARKEGGHEAINLKVAEQYVQAFGQLAQKGNTLILPSNLSDIAGLVGTAMSMVKTENTAAQGIAQVQANKQN